LFARARMENDVNGSIYEILADKIWESYYRVRVSKCYFGRLARQYRQKETCVRLFLALSTSSVAWGYFSNYIPTIWKIVSVIAAVTAIVTTKLNFQKSMYESKMLEERFSPFAADYKRLLLDIELGEDSEAVRRTYNYLVEKQELVQIPTKFKKYKEKLMHACQDEVEQDEGI